MTVSDMPPAKGTPKSGSKPGVRWKAVYAALGAAIVCHRLGPGRKLPGDELAGIDAVSRSAVRAALQALAHDRLVRLEPNRGAFVARPSRNEAREVFEARALIEPRVAALAAEKAKPADVARLRRHLQNEERAVRSGDPSTAIALSAQFHVAVARIAGHSILAEFVSDLVSRSSLIVALYWHRRDTTCDSHAHHGIVDAIADRRPMLASEVMKTHLSDLQSNLDLSLLDTEPKSLAEVLGS